MWFSIKKSLYYSSSSLYKLFPLTVLAFCHNSPSYLRTSADTEDSNTFSTLLFLANSSFFGSPLKCHVYNKPSLIPQNKLN